MAGKQAGMALLELRYFSPALGKQNAALALVPDAGFAGKLPVFYLLHGLSDDHTTWLRRTRLEQYAQAYRMMVVMPDGGTGFYADGVHGAAYRTAIAMELVDYVDALLPTVRSRKGRGIGGLSMGGYGALKFGITYPERFGSVTAHSSAIDFGHRSLDRWKNYLHLLGSKQQGGPEDLYAAARQLAKTGKPQPAIRMDCGTEDALLEMNRRFSAHMTKVGIPHAYEEFQGGHTWDYWDLRIRESLAFHAKAMGRAATRA